MLNKKLQTDHWNEMCFQLLKLMTKQLKNPGSGRILGIKRLHDDLGVNTAKEEMDLETAQTTTTAKLPTLKQGGYDMWRLSIKQYFQVQDYALWDVIENENSFKPAAKKQTNADDAKTLFAAIQIRFGGNEATKKTQKTILKQMYEIFSPPSTESLDSIFNRLQKIKTRRNITINRSDTTGYDKSKVECFNCYKLGHFARECRGHRNQDSRNKNQDNSRRTVNVEEISSKAMMIIDGAGFD
ncbi:ribonuclease H-like domain-containing protein [Tanacetum coccineum]